ncbi:MAG: zinc ribbon domain-containing protein [Promethearchaeota archaeon]|jgi:NADH pyrophosphatase NudC (nudix superfamily)
MNFKYGYFSVNQNLEDVWEKSRIYWNSLENMKIKKNSSFATKSYAIMNVSKKRPLKQSEEYYLKFVIDPNLQDITHVRVSFEYLGDSLLGTEAGMQTTVNEWIKLLDVEPINFQSTPIKENEIFFIDSMEETQVRKKGGQFCPYCGNKIKTLIKFCPECGSQLKI